MATTTAPKSEELQAQTHLVRTIEAALKISCPDADELRFRSSLLACAEAQLPTLKPAFVTRCYEAACDVKFPSDEVTNFRKALNKIIGRSLNLKQYRRQS